MGFVSRQYVVLSFQKLSCRYLVDDLKQISFVQHP